MKKLIWSLLVITLSALALLSCAQAEGTHTTVETGVCGGSVTWEVWVDEEGVRTLEVSGNGPVSESIGTDLIYWVNRIVLNEGITDICDYAFSQAGSVREIRIPASCVRIGEQAFDSGHLHKVTLAEGLQVIESHAFSYYAQGMCAVVIPESVVEINAGALSGLIPAVYPGSEGESYCQDCGIKNYILLDRKKDNTHLMALMDAVLQVEDVPMRYRGPAAAMLSGMNLTDDQCDTLRDYVLAEERALKLAMYDNSLTAGEVLGFVGRFAAAMDGVGVEIQYELSSINGYPGVRLTAAVNGRETAVDVYRTGAVWYIDNLEAAEADDYLYTEVEGGIMITGYTGDEQVLTIPAAINRKPVVSISGSGNYPDITSLTIPEGVLRIEPYTMANKWGLKTLILPDSLEYIGGHAFEWCYGLSEVSFGSHLRELGDYAFSQSRVSRFVLPASLEILGRGSYPQLVINEENPYFSTDVQGALYCDRTHTLISYPQDGPAACTVRPGTLYIGDQAFSGNETIASVALPDGLLGIGSGAFSGCVNLSDINLPDSIETIGGQAFEGVQMPHVHIPGKLFTDGSYDYYLNNPDGYLYDDPEDERLYWLQQLFQAVFGVDGEAERYTVGAGNPFFSSRDGVLFTADAAVLMKYPRASENRSYQVPAGTRKIQEGAFSGCRALQSVAMPASLSVIDENAFNACSQLTTVHLAEGLSVIGDYAFYSCGQLSTINLPDSLTQLGSGCLDGAALETLVIPEEIKILRNPGNLPSLKTLCLPASVTDWGYGWESSVDVSQLTVKGYTGSRAEDFAREIGCAFEPVGGEVQSVSVDPGRLTVALGDTVSVSAQVVGGAADTVRWREDTGAEYDGLLEIVSPYGGSVQFRAVAMGTTALIASAGEESAVCEIEVVMPDSAAGGNTMRLPENLTAIEAGAFSYSGAEIVIIPDGTNVIGSRAFFDCGSLQVVQIPDSVTYIAGNAFDGCKSAVFVCSPGSYAAAYAEQHRIPRYSAPSR